MPQFTYTAKNHKGEIVSSTVEAVSRESLIATLRQQRLLPTSIKEKKGTNFFSQEAIMTMIGHVSLVEKLQFIKNLSVTLRAGLPVSKALTVVTAQMPNAFLRKVVNELASSVQSGKSLSESMGAYPKVFPPLVVNMVSVGEQSGNLEDTLDYLGKQIARDYNLVRRTRGALMYPAVVVFALLVIGYLMFTFVLPNLTATFKDFDTELPFLTVAIITTVDIFSQYSLLVFVIAASMIAGLWWWHRTHSGKLVFHKLILVFPVLNKIAKKINMARFTIIFSGLLRSGMPIVQALHITGNTMSNYYYQEALRDTSEKVKVGVDMVVALENYPKLFTPMVTQMIMVGEESGTMEQVLNEVSTFYETEVDDTVKNLSSIIEPILVLIIGAVVGVLAVGLILPIYNIGQAI